MCIKTFNDLIEEVHKPGICQECGGCVSFCNAIENEVIGFKKPNSPPEYINKEKCFECGICYFICPQTHILDDELNLTYNFTNFLSMPLGFIKSLYSCQATDNEFLKHGTDGGVVNSILNHLLENKIIEGAIVAKTNLPFSREASIVSNKEELINASGIKLDISPQLESVQKFYTYTSSLPKLRSQKVKKLALVGTPCQIYSIRCMQNLSIIPSENIEVCLGLFCYENFFFNREKVEKFENDFHFKFKNIEKVNIREDLLVKLKNDITIHIPFKKLNDYMRQACSVCSDFANIYADISFGGLASPEKFTTVITRTKKGEDIMNKALKAGIIKSLKLNMNDKNKMMEKITQFSHSKISRTERNMKNKLMD